MKHIAEIIHTVEIIQAVGALDRQVCSICIDSRKVAVGCAFIAIKGIQSDGHAYIPQAVQSGATCIICETLPDKIDTGATYIVVKNSSIAAGIISSNFFDNPSSKLNLVGITGTNGKTTTITSLYTLFRNLGYKAGAITTISNYIHDTVIPATHTTPDPVMLNQLMKQMVDTGVTHCFMEVSSHAIEQNRIAGLTFRGSIFSNITHDHLDYHKTFDAYIKAKKKFFDDLSPQAFALSNADDKNGAVMMQNTKAQVKFYGLKSMADFKVKIIECSFEGMLINCDNTEVWVKLIGEFNAYNILCVYSAAIMLGENKERVLQCISNLTPVRGRLECIYGKNNITGIVDYAHTPDAVENVLKTITKIKSKGQKVITVIGAGGNRDKTKRPIMAKVASQYSDTVILTSDNPRNEVPEDIINDMKQGVVDSKNVIAITDRREAIKTAAMMAQPKDILLVAGKGHEDYQEIHGVKHHFDDAEIIREVIN